MKTKKRLGKFACALVIMAMTLGLAVKSLYLTGRNM